MPVPARPQNRMQALMKEHNDQAAMLKLVLSGYADFLGRQRAALHALLAPGGGTPGGGGGALAARLPTPPPAGAFPHNVAVDKWLSLVTTVVRRGSWFLLAVS